MDGCLNFQFHSIHVFFLFHETKGHSLEEMTAMFESGVPAWKSSGYQPKITEDIERATHGDLLKTEATNDESLDKKVSPKSTEVQQ